MHDSSAPMAILVPLDGSELAEQALPVAAWLGHALHATLVLVRIIPMEAWAYFPPTTPEAYQRLVDEEDRMVREYVERLAVPLRQQGMSVLTRTERGEPATMLLDLAPVVHASLIVMSTHGRTGMGRFAVGSVAYRVVRYGHLPVLLLRSGRATAVHLPMDQLLVPLDGSSLAEQALEMAVQLAGHAARALTLLRVVPSGSGTGTFEEARSYLESVQRRLQTQDSGHTFAITTRVVEGVPAEQIRTQAAQIGCLVIMATHGRSGLQEWVLGSVADQVVHEAAGPVLVIHPSAPGK